MKKAFPSMIKARNHKKKINKFYLLHKRKLSVWPKLLIRNIKLKETFCNSYHRQNLIYLIYKELLQSVTKRPTAQYKNGKILLAFILYKEN